LFLGFKDKYNGRAELVEIIHTKDNLLFRVSMPGQCIEDVKIFKYQNTFVVRAKHNHCTRSILAADITGTFCNIDKIEAEMKGSNLEIVIPTYNIPDMIPVEVKTAARCIKTPLQHFDNVYRRAPDDPVVYANGRVWLHYYDN
jgi:hypothetical protein